MNRRLAIQFNIFIINQTTEENITDLFYLQSCRCHIRSTHMWIGKKMGNRTTMKVWDKCTLKLTLFFSIKIKKKPPHLFLHLHRHSKVGKFISLLLLLTYVSDLY